MAGACPRLKLWFAWRGRRSSGKPRRTPSGNFRLDGLTTGRLSSRSYTPTDLPKPARTSRSSSASVQGITVTMRLETFAQSVNVKGQASSVTTQPINTTSTVHQGAVSAQDLQDIPLAARSFANIAYLVPGTEPVEPSDPTKARITAVSFGGSSGLNVQLSVDGADNSDDYIGGFLQNFSPDTIQEFAVRTSQEDADTGRTTAGSVVIVTKRGTDQWHGDGAFYERAASLNARFPIDNPPPNPKQPFSRQNYIGTIGGPIEKGKVWFFSSLEAVHEDASVAYSPASLAQFNALASLAAEGLIPGADSIPVPSNVPVPFRDYLGTTRFDWTQSTRSQWFLRAATDNYHTYNDLVQQATLPIHRRDVGFTLLELRGGKSVHLQPDLAGIAHCEREPAAPHRIAELESWVCPGIPLQLDLQLDFRIRDFRRQPVRYAHHRVPRDPQSGKVPVPLRCESRFRPPRAALRSGPDPRTRDERRAFGNGRESNRLPAGPGQLSRQSATILNRSFLRPDRNSGDDLRGHARRQRQLFAEPPAPGILRGGFLALDLRI